MRKIERIGITVLAVLLLAGLFACGRSDSAKETNGDAIAFDFSETTNGVPNGWTVNSYEGGYQTFAENGEVGFSVPDGDDCRLCRTVDVKPETRYVLSAELRTEDVEDGRQLHLFRRAVRHQWLDAGSACVPDRKGTGNRHACAASRRIFRRIGRQRMVPERAA